MTRKTTAAKPNRLNPNRSSKTIRKTPPAHKAARKMLAPPPKSAQPPETKIDRIVALLRTREGASLEALIEATGWQAHSVRGAISGTLKKKLALTIVSERIEGE